MATFMSSITLLGVSAENYVYGTHFIIINISYGVFTPVAAYLYLPVFYKLQTTSVYEVGKVHALLLVIMRLYDCYKCDGLFCST